jgi:hypothetical protein
MELVERIRVLELEQSKIPIINNVVQPNHQKDDPWHLIVGEDGIETWIRPSHVTYISPISESNMLFTFSAIIDGCMTGLSFKTKDAATEFRNILLNINTIPESNTYETKKEPFTIMKEIESQMNSRKRMTQEEVDSLKLKNKKD